MLAGGIKYCMLAYRNTVGGIATFYHFVRILSIHVVQKILLNYPKYNSLPAPNAKTKKKSISGRYFGAYKCESLQFIYFLLEPYSSNSKLFQANCFVNIFMNCKFHVWHKRALMFTTWHNTHLYHWKTWKKFHMWNTSISVVSLINLQKRSLLIKRSVMMKLSSCCMLMYGRINLIILKLVRRFKHTSKYNSMNVVMLCLFV